MKTVRKPSLKRVSDKPKPTLHASKPGSGKAGIGHKQAEETIRFQANLLANLNDAIIASDENNHITVWNSAAESMYGWKAEEVLGKLATEIVKTEFEGTDRSEVIRALAETGKWRGEVMQARKDESRFPIETAAITLRDAQGKITGYVSVNRDITGRKQAEDEARGKQKLFQKTFDTSPLASVLSKLPERTVVDVNPAFEKLFGYTRVEMLGRPVNEFDLWANASERQHVAEVLLKNGSVHDLEFMFKTKAGETGYGIFYSETIEQLPDQYVLVKVLDITERRRTEAQVRYQASLLANIGDAIIASGEDNRIKVWNRAAESMYGWKAEEVLGKTTPEIVKTEFNGTDRSEVLRVLAQTGTWRGEITQARKDGTRFYAETIAIVRRDAQGKVTDYVGVNRDITERKQAEATHAQLAAIVDSSDDAIIGKTLDGVITSWNSGAERLYGYSAEEAIGQSLSLIIPPNHPDELPEILAQLKRGESIKHFETVRLRKDSTLINVALTISLIRDGAGNVTGASTIARDITERKRAEERQEFLMSASKALASSLDYETTLTTVAQLAVPKIADWCTVYLTAPDGSIEQVALTHADPDKVKWARKLQKQFPPNPNAPQGVAQVIRSGQAEFTPEIPAELLEPLKKDPEMSKLLDELQLTGGMTVPLTLRGRTLGAISFVSAESRLRYTTKDLELAEELARRAALAISNALLFQQVQDELTERKQAEGALLDSQARTAGIINSAMDAIISIDAEQQIVLFNPAAEVMFQCEQAEAVGQPVEHFLPERFRMSHRQHIQRFAETGVTSRAMGTLGTIYGLRKHGEEFPIEASISQTLVAGQSIFTVILRDVTKRQRAEEALRQSQENFAKAFHANPAAIAITRLVDGKFINVNPAYLRIMEYEPQELLEHTAAEINIYAYPEERALLIQQLKEEGFVQNYELRVRVKSGEIRSIILSMQPILYNEEECILSVFIDISERKKMEGELQRSNTELEQFAYVASHDLQEPLRAVAGMVQLLGQRYKGKLDERADEYIGHAVEASGRMQNLINDLLDYSRVDRLGKPFASTDLERTLDVALANLQVAIQESGAQITHDALPTVMADASQLTQLFQNLIGNAIKFRGERVPRIHIGVEKAENGWRFSVRDNGIGIEPQYFERIFLVFQRLHTRREYSGTGIGLALCKKIIERHKGQIWIESEPGKGSIFYFTFPER